MKCDKCGAEGFYITRKGNFCSRGCWYKMRIVELIRLEEDFKSGTFGVLKIDKKVFCVTLEPPDKLNAQNISSIPAQQYICERVVSPRFGETFEIMNVPDRTRVLFHAGNVVQHTEGCVIVAQYFGKLKKKRAIMNSGITFDNFMTEMDGQDEFHLTIQNNF